MPKLKSEPAAEWLTERSSILLDTHVAVWLAAGSRIKPRALSLIEAAFEGGKLCLSPISAWEIGVLVAKNRLDLGQSPLNWLEGVIREFNITIAELTPQIGISSSFLPGDFHGDPADRILIATARTYSCAIASADREILSYGSQGHVKVLAC